MVDDLMCLSYFVGAEIGDLVFLEVFLGKIEVFNPRMSKGGGDQMDPPIGVSNLKLEAFKQSK